MTSATALCEKSRITSILFSFPLLVGITLTRREDVVSSNFFTPLFPKFLTPLILSSLPKLYLRIPRMNRQSRELEMITSDLISLSHLSAVGGGALTMFTQLYEVAGGYSEFMNVECFK